MLSTLRLGSHSFCDLCHRASSEQWNTSTFDFHSNNHRHQIERLCSRFTIPEHRMTTRMTSMNTKCRRPWHVVEGTAIVLRRVFLPVYRSCNLFIRLGEEMRCSASCISNRRLASFLWEGLAAVKTGRTPFVRLQSLWQRAAMHCFHFHELKRT